MKRDQKPPPSGGGVVTGTSVQTIDAEADARMVFHRRREAARARIEAAGRAYRAERAAAFKLEEAERKRLVAAAAEAALVAQAKLLAERPISRRVADRQNAQRIRAEVAAAAGLRMIVFESNRRTNCIVLPRQFAMWSVHRETALSLPEIGRCFGGFHHSTVIHACRKIDRMLEAGELPAQYVAMIPQNPL